MLKKSTRKQMEETALKVFDAIDPTGINTEYYKNMFGAMDDKQFEHFALNMFNDHRQFLTLEIASYRNEPTLQSIEKAAKVLGVPLYERMAYPYQSEDPDKPFVTIEPVPVGFIHIKRLQQMKRKKNSTSTTIEKRDSKTGQVTGKDKNSRSSDMENYAMSTYGATEAMKEFLGPRADDFKAKSEFYSDIYKNGYADLNNLTNDPRNKKTLNTLNVYFMCMGLLSDLISPGYVLQSTLDER